MPPNKVGRVLRCGERVAPLRHTQAAQKKLFDPKTLLDRVQEEVGVIRLEMQRQGLGLTKHR